MAPMVRQVRGKSLVGGVCMIAVVSMLILANDSRRKKARTLQKSKEDLDFELRRVGDERDLDVNMFPDPTKAAQRDGGRQYVAPAAPAGAGGAGGSAVAGLEADLRGAGLTSGDLDAAIVYELEYAPEKAPPPPSPRDTHGRQMVPPADADAYLAAAKGGPVLVQKGEPGSVQITASAG